MRLDDSDEDLDIAARYASELQSLHDKCLHDPGFCTEILLHPFTAANPDTDPLAIRHPDTGLFIGKHTLTVILSRDSVASDANT